MKVLIIGGGGREHALAWRIAQSKSVRKIYVAPGNAGTGMEPKTKNINFDPEDIPGLLHFAHDEKIDLTIVGPEAPLVSGIVDEFEQAGLNCFGPRKNAAQLEGSKSFCKDFLKRHKIPTAEYGVFTNSKSACEYVREKGAPIVIKADGLAAGKGVVIAQTLEEAIQSIKVILDECAFGKAGKRLVIEEYLQGEEASFIVIANGTQVLPLATSQDHKARDDGDKGPNTGGMGAYSPAPVITPEIHQQIMDKIINPTLVGMEKEGMPYTGFLYAGLMITKEGTAKVLEYNCRFGDPETQPILMRLNGDFAQLIVAVQNKQLENVQVNWDDRAALAVVMTAGGYPGNYSKGDAIQGLPSRQQDALKVFHAGTRFENGTVVTNGGRVLCACALAADLATAQQSAYTIVRNISWDNAYYRRDIGYRSVKRGTY